MVDQIIRPSALPNRATPNPSEKIPVDNGSTVGGATVESIVLAGRPTASQMEAEAGTNAIKSMTPLTTKQSISSEIGLSIASKAQGDKADTAVQPGSLAAVATTGAYEDLSGKPTLGTAAAQNTSAFATAAQGGKADTAVQPGALATVATSGQYGDLLGTPVIPPGLSDGNKGDITVASTGTLWTLNPDVSGVSLLSVAVLQATNVRVGTKSIRVFGYSTPLDGGGHQRKRVASQPTHGGGVRSLDRFMPDGSTDATNGGWWDVDEVYPNELMFGGVAGQTNAVQTAAIQSSWDYAAANKHRALVATGHAITATLVMPDFLAVDFANRGYSGSGAILNKVFNGDMIVMGNACALNSPALRGNASSGTPRTGRGIVINAGGDQVINDPLILDMESYCLEFTTGGQGIRFRMNGGLIQSATGFAVRMPATEATTTGFRHFNNVHTGGTPFIDFRNGNYTTLDGCVFTDVNYGSTTTGRTKIANCRIASLGGVLIFGIEHSLIGNTCGSGITIGSGAQRCVVVGNISTGVTNSSGNATNIVTGNT